MHFLVCRISPHCNFFCPAKVNERALRNEKKREKKLDDTLYKVEKNLKAELTLENIVIDSAS